MKKIICIILGILFSITTCSCDPGTFVIKDEYLKGIISVELINYTNPDQKGFILWAPNQFDKLKKFNNDNYVVLETLPNKKINSFLDSFKNTDILHTYYAYDSPKDICIRLNYSNGNFLIIWTNYKYRNYQGYIGQYLSDGSVLSFWGCFSAYDYYRELVEYYFDIKLE